MSTKLEPPLTPTVATTPPPVLAPTTPVGLPAPPKRRRHRRWPYALAGVIVFLVVASLVMTRPWSPTLLSADFNDGTGPFPVATTGSASAAYIDGGYMVTILDPTHDTTTVTQLRRASSTIGVSADVSFPDFALGSWTGAGVLAMSSSTEGYMFGVGTDRSFILVKVVDPQHDGSQEFNQIGIGTIPAAAGYPKTLRLDASTDGGRVSLAAWVNGVQVTTGSDTSGGGAFNRVGLYSAADEGGAKILFDNVLAATS
jgi:hypothetical protein